MPATLFTIDRGAAGRLGTMAAPRGDEWLAGELADLTVAGVDILVSMLTDSEAAELGLAGEAEAARAAGLAFHRLPTPDLRVPDRAATLALAARLLARLRDGAGVAVHCRMGIGRSSTLAAAILVLDGLEPARAWERIAAARGLPVPETAAQRGLIDTLTLPA